MYLADGTALPATRYPRRGASPTRRVASASFNGSQGKRGLQVHR